MSAVARVLLAEDEPHLGLILETFLKGRGHHVTRVGDGRAALDAARAATFDVALLDVVMPEMDGLAVLGALVELPLAPEAVVMTGNGTVETALHALGLGAYDYLSKPYRMAEVDELVRRAAEKRALRVAAARTDWERARCRPPAPWSAHPPLRDALARAADAATRGCPPLLVAGEPGTGRRTVARWLASLADPSVAVVTLACTGDAAADGAALFGHPGGPEAAAAERAGALGLAAGGTLLVVDADRLTDCVAARLVEALECGRYDRADGSGTGAAPARLMATSTCAWRESGSPLARHVRAHGVLSLPRLVERVVDISVLAERFLPPDGTPRRLAPDALAALAARRWPGNLAELRCVVGAAAYRATGAALTAADLLSQGWVGAAEPGEPDAAAPPTSTSPTSPASPAPSPSSPVSLADLERRQIAAVLEEEGWHRGRAAARLGISQRTLYRRIREYGFDRPRA